MKILRIGDILKPEVNPSSSSTTRGNAIRKSEDTSLVDKVFVSPETTLRNMVLEMNTVQDNISVLQKKLVGISELAEVIKRNNFNINENTLKELNEIIDNTTYNNKKVLENLRETLSSNRDISSIMDIISKEFQKVKSEIDNAKKTTNSLLIKFENIQTATISQSYEDIVKVTSELVSKLNFSKSSYNINPENVNRLISS